MSSGEWRGAVSNDGYEYSHTDDDERLSVSDSSSNSTVVKEEYHDESEIFGGSIGLFTGLSNLQRSYNDTWLIGGNTSLLGAIFIVCNAALGIGVVNIPHAVLSIGDLYVALACQSIVVCVVLSTLFLLGFCAEKCQVSSYESVIGSLWGHKVKLAVEVIIVLNGFFACIMFLIIAGDQLPHVLCLLDGSKEPAEFREMSIVLSSLVILPLCIPKDISYLSYPGLVSVVAVTYLPIAIVLRYYRREKEPEEPSPKFTDINFTWLGLLHALPTFVLAYQCHLSCVPCYASLKKRSMIRWAFIISSALVVVSGIYALVGFFGFMTFGNQTKSDVLLNYASSDDVITLGRLTLLCSVIFSFPNMHFVSRSAYQSLLRCTDNVSSPVNSFFTPAWLLGTLSSALFIPEIGVVINRFGPVAAFFILGFPGLCLIQLSYRSCNRGAGSRAVAAVGIIGGVMYCCLCALVLTCSLLSFNITDDHTQSHNSSHTNTTNTILSEQQLN
ncbi:sodium-coupled neutral amino acid transporter 7-like [Convolutriloba macropyga]|uniref:sodium-coupled neutral amino acid transporter 7-like n=1 Tax=Convolutriloba macropyga TaxID=536237 RepID=UPI003F51F9C2